MVGRQYKKPNPWSYRRVHTSFTSPLASFKSKSKRLVGNWEASGCVGFLIYSCFTAPCPARNAVPADICGHPVIERPLTHCAYTLLAAIDPRVVAGNRFSTPCPPPASPVGIANEKVCMEPAHDARTMLLSWLRLVLGRARRSTSHHTTHKMPHRWNNTPSLIDHKVGLTTPIPIFPMLTGAKCKATATPSRRLRRPNFASLGRPGTTVARSSTASWVYQVSGAKKKAPGYELSMSSATVGSIYLPNDDRL